MEQHLLEAVSDGVATLTLNRPERLNALSTPIMEGLLEALPRLWQTDHASPSPLMKQNFNAAENGSLAQLLDLEARRQVETGRTEDHKEAARAFVEKRAPALAGR
jgi:enoyl-CoA hydratase/carnithine racemase